MHELYGCAGRKSGLVLRVGQCVFAAASMGVMASVEGIITATAFRHLMTSMGLLAMWSFGLACINLHALRFNKDLYIHHMFVRVVAVGDWVAATVSLSAACASAGVIVLYSRDTEKCTLEDDDFQFACNMVQMSVAFAFSSWSLLAVSSYIMLFLLASM